MTLADSEYAEITRVLKESIWLWQDKKSGIEACTLSYRAEAVAYTKARDVLQYAECRDSSGWLAQTHVKQAETTSSIGEAPPPVDAIEDGATAMRKHERNTTDAASSAMVTTPHAAPGTTESQPHPAQRDMHWRTQECQHVPDVKVDRIIIETFE